MDTGSIGRPTFGGLASGLDTNALLNGLLELERIPLNRLRSRQSEIETQRGLMRQLNTKLIALRKAAQEIDNRNSTGSSDSIDEEFLRYSGSSTDDDIVSVTAGAGAAPGEIEVQVEQLARGSRIFSTSYASDADVALAVGEFFEITLPNDDPDATPPVEATSVRIEATADSGALTLQDLRDQINTNAGNGGTLRADILKVADGDFQLVVKTTGTGVSNQISTTGDFQLQTPDPDRDDALNARFFLFGGGGDQGIALERETNVVSDALSGVTLRLNRVAREDESNPGVPVSETVTVDVDVDEIAKSIETFTKAYNDVVDFLDAQFRYDDVNKRSGPLSGDFTLRRVQSQLQSLVSRGFSFSTNESNPFAPGGDNGLGGAISNIGIEVEGGGRLRLDKSKLEEALALDPISVREFLKGRPTADFGDDDDATVDYDPGFAQLVANELEELVKSGDGLLASRDQAFADRIAEFDDSIERFEFRLGQREETLIARFSELERIVSGLQSQQGFLAGIG